MIVSIPGHSGYSVSDQGQVFGYRGSSYPLALSPNGYGYLKVKITGGKTAKVHHLVALAFLGPRPEGLVINHKDGNKTNNCINNLEYVTYSENSRHAYATGLTPIRGRKPKPAPKVRVPLHGEQSPQHKLTTADVLEMRRLHEDEHTSTRAIARMFGVSQPTVCRVVKRIKWRHV